MRLTGKIVAVFMIGIVLLTSLHGYILFQRESRQLREDMEEAALGLGRAMEESLLVTWRDTGHEGVVRAVRSADAHHQHTTIRWLTLQLAHDESRPAPLIQQLQASSRRQIATFTARDERGQLVQRMYYPIEVENQRTGYLEFSEPLTKADRYLRGTIYQTAATTAAMLMCGLLVSLLGVRLVGRPLEQLIDKTDRIGRGDFSGDLELTGHDELTQLAEALNTMSHRLASQQQQLQTESTARVAAVEQLRHVDRLKTVGRLASGIAHELGTPLNVVSGRAELIASGKLNEDQARDSAQAIKSEADRMATIIRQLLDFARRKPPQRTMVDLRHVARQCVQLLQPLAQKNSVTIVLDDDDRLLSADVDATQIQQVVTNLVVNAIQAMPQGGQVTISLDREERDAPDGTRQVVFSVAVRDQGAGIADADRESLFEPFFTTKETGEGTGLGLSVSYGIVQDHGGWIDVTSAPGEGSCFTVVLPAEDPS